MDRMLTGITPSGSIHLGNYVGCIESALSAQSDDMEHLYFIADNHSLIKLQDAQLRQQYIYEVAATWLACGLDPTNTLFYRQSAVPEIMELNWILNTVAAKGLLNRAHAYKDRVAKNEGDNQDPDYGITMGLFCYPVLMAADILAFNARYIPVGKDQVQHLEIARDIAARFNHIYQTEMFVLPEAVVDKNTESIVGLDGRKMSKSYHNTIPLFTTTKKLRKQIMKIVTNSQLPGEPKDPASCNIFNLYQVFATPEEVAALEQAYQAGIGWGEAKERLYQCIEARLAQPRERYFALIEDHAYIDQCLAEGAARARAIAAPILAQVKQKVGLSAA